MLMLHVYIYYVELQIKKKRKYLQLFELFPTLNVIGYLSTKAVTTYLPDKHQEHEKRLILTKTYEPSSEMISDK